MYIYIFSLILALLETLRAKRGEVPQRGGAGRELRSAVGLRGSIQCFFSNPGIKNFNPGISERADIG